MMRFATTCFTRVSFCRHAHNTLHESTRKTDSHTQYVRAFAGESRKTVSTASLLAACSTHTRRHTQSLSRIAKQRGTRTDKNEPKRRLGDEHVRRPAACQTHTHTQTPDTEHDRVTGCVYAYHCHESGNAKHSTHFWN